HARNGQNDFLCSHCYNLPAYSASVIIRLSIASISVVWSVIMVCRLICTHAWHDQNQDNDEHPYALSRRLPPMRFSDSANRKCAANLRWFSAGLFPCHSPQC